MTGYVLSVDAVLDLDEIWEHIAAQDIDAAEVVSFVAHSRHAPRHFERIEQFSYPLVGLSRRPPAY